MKTGLLIGKWSLIVLIWILVLLTFNSSIDAMVIIKFSVGLFVTIMLVTAGFAIFNFSEAPKTGIKFLISTGVLGLVFLISYMISSDIDPKTGLAVEGSKLSEAGIYTFYVGFIIAALAIVASEVKRALKL